MSIDLALKINKDNDRHYQEYDILNISKSIAENQTSINSTKSILSKPHIIEMLTKFEDEIDNEGINKNSIIYHGARHIKNVLLFSLLIAVGENITDTDLKLLLYAAKYHDIGREQVGEGQIPHAEESANIIPLRIPVLSMFEISIIQTVIAFHEIPRNNKKEAQIFKEIAMRYGIEVKHFKRVRFLCEILKDADALDRMRFSGSGRTNIKLLKSQTSKKLIMFASILHEQFALEDLAVLNCNDEASFLLKQFTPQNIIFEIQRASEVIPNIKCKKELLKLYAHCAQNGVPLYDYNVYKLLKNKH